MSRFLSLWNLVLLYCFTLAGVLECSGATQTLYLTPETFSVQSLNQGWLYDTSKTDITISFAPGTYDITGPAGLANDFAYQRLIIKGGGRIIRFVATNPSQPRPVLRLILTSS